MLGRSAHHVAVGAYRCALFGGLASWNWSRSGRGDWSAARVRRHYGCEMARIWSVHCRIHDGYNTKAALPRGLPRFLCLLLRCRVALSSTTSMLATLQPDSLFCGCWKVSAGEWYPSKRMRCSREQVARPPFSSQTHKGRPCRPITTNVSGLNDDLRAASRQSRAEQEQR